MCEWACLVVVGLWKFFEIWWKTWCFQCKPLWILTVSTRRNWIRSWADRVKIQFTSSTLSSRYFIQYYDYSCGFFNGKQRTESISMQNITFWLKNAMNSLQSNQSLIDPAHEKLMIQIDLWETWFLVRKYWESSTIWSQLGCGRSPILLHIYVVLPVPSTAIFLVFGCKLRLFTL